MKNYTFIKIMLAIIGLLLLLNLFSDFIPLKLNARVLNQYKVERILTVNATDAQGQLMIKLNDIMNNYAKGNIVAVVNGGSTENENVWYVIVRVW